MTSFKAAQWLRAGIAAAKAGDAERARELLLQVVDADELNEHAWIWLSSVVESDEDREICLDNVLAINPDNSLAKAGRAHLRSRQAAAAPPPPPQPEPTPPPLAPSESAQEAADDWWDRPFLTDEPAAESTDLEARMAAAVAPPVEAEKQAPPKVEKEEVPFTEQEAEPEKKGRRRSGQRFQRLAAAMLFILGLLAAAGAVMALLQMGPFDPTANEYADVMRPLLDDYDAWWEGPYGALVNELNSLCGPGADGWRNQDVLLTCSQHAEVDCVLLAAHCGADVEAMRERVGALSQGAQKEGAQLRAAFANVAPPDDVALAHGRFLACLQEQVEGAGRAGDLARGDLPPGAPPVPACQMFSEAEENVRRYVGSW